MSKRRSVLVIDWEKISNYSLNKGQEIDASEAIENRLLEFVSTKYPQEFIEASNQFCQYIKSEILDVQDLVLLSKSKAKYLAKDGVMNLIEDRLITIDEFISLSEEKMDILDNNDFKKLYKDHLILFQELKDFSIDKLHALKSCFDFLGKEWFHKAKQLSTDKIKVIANDDVGNLIKNEMINFQEIKEFSKEKITAIVNYYKPNKIFKYIPGHEATYVMDKEKQDSFERLKELPVEKIEALGKFYCVFSNTHVSFSQFESISSEKIQNLCDLEYKDLFVVEESRYLFDDA